MAHDRGRTTAVVAGIVGLAVVAAAYLLGDSIPRAGVSRPDGQWVLRLPAGFTHEIRLEPEDPRRTEFRWKIVDEDTLRLMDQPPRAETGADYLGATMTRKR